MHGLHPTSVKGPVAGVDGGVHQPRRHDSADKQVSGSAFYVDDMAEPRDMVHVQFGLSTEARAKIRSMDLTAVRQAEGVICVLTADDVPGENDVGPVVHDEPMFARDEVFFAGQCLFAVVAETRLQARHALKLARIDYEPLEAVLDVETAIERDMLYEPPYRMGRGDVDGALAGAQHTLKGSIEIGGQEHFYLEGQAASAVPGEDDDMFVLSSTQHPSEIQDVVARVLDQPSHSVVVECRRMGGGFGGKESQANLSAAAAALAARVTGRPAKVRLDRDDDMILTGKRHAAWIDYEVGFDHDGRLTGMKVVQKIRCGWSQDLSLAIADRAMFHADNAYFIPAVEIVSYRCRTNTVSDTAFRGFGGPQGLVACERILDQVAHALKLDPLEVRKRNFYDPIDKVADRAMTPYGMTVEDNVLHEMVAELEASSDYTARRSAIRRFNETSPVLKRGIALTPVKFGISFTVTHLNQAGALVHIYKDGSVMLNHGGTEMGQGLFVKVAQVAAEVLCVDLDHVKITSTRTDKVPNTSPTAASSGADMNGMAVRAACETLKTRLTEFAARHYGVNEDEVIFSANHVHVGERLFSFKELVHAAYMGRVSLSATGYYATPGITWNRKEGTGRPFYYFAYGAAVSEVAIDILTGEHRLLRVDILHETGQSLNPAIDLGQIEGGFAQGAGWLTTEELWWDKAGRLKTHAPSTYKIPVASDRAPDTRVALWDKGINREQTIFRSKAVGEPPLMLAASVLFALSDAVAQAGNGTYPELDAPATPERVLMALERVGSAVDLS